MTKENLEELDETGLMYLLLCSLISADHLNSKENCELSLNELNHLIEVLPSCNIDNREEYIDYCKKGLEIVERDLMQFIS